jgi:pantoate--beta-alanine ligase
MKKTMTKVIETVADIQAFIADQKKLGKTVGFTPTLGALHDGHMSLMEKSIEENDISVVSIFVNPTQFNETSDLKKYPRTYKADLRLLENNECDVLFFPSTQEVYPKGTKHRPKVNLGGLDKELEGAFRPGHFDGVVQVVHRLLDIVKPERLYMGQKDFQQFTIIDRMINKLKMPVKLVVCPIKRADSGLAMASRNMRLTKSQKAKATIIHKTLMWAKEHLSTHSVEEIINYTMTRMAIDDFKPEYFKLIDGNTLKDIKNVSKHKYIVAVTAVWAGDVRLIDNMILRGGM